MVGRGVVEPRGQRPRPGGYGNLVLITDVPTPVVHLPSSRTHDVDVHPDVQRRLQEALRAVCPRSDSVVVVVRDDDDGSGDDDSDDVGDEKGVSVGGTGACGDVSRVLRSVSPIVR